jgi:hypothetical protein
MSVLQCQVDNLSIGKGKISKTSESEVKLHGFGLMLRKIREVRGGDEISEKTQSQEIKRRRTATSTSAAAVQFNRKRNTNQLGEG